MGIETLIPTLNLPLAALGAAVFLGGLTMRQVFVSMIGCSIVLIGLAGGHYMPGIIGGIAVQVVGAAAELLFGRRARWASTLLGNLGCFVVAGSTLGSQFIWQIH